MVRCMSSTLSRASTVLFALLAGVWLAGCVSHGQPRHGYRGYNDPYAYGPYDDYYYDSHPDYIVIDPDAARLERHQRRETKGLNQEQNAEKRALKQEQESERRALKDAGEWDKQDRLDQKVERKQQKQIFKQEDRALRQHQREEWEQY